MATLDNTHDETNEATAAFEQKAEAITDALNAAPNGRHKQEQNALQAAQEQASGRASEADRELVDTFFAQQRAQLEQVQRAELEVGKGAVAAADTVEDLSSAVDAIGSMHRDVHDRLSAARDELESALAVDDASQRAELLDDLVQRQDAEGFAAAFSSAPGDLWTAADVEERLAAGAGSEKTMQKAARSADEATNDNRHQRGNFGERAATEALAADGFAILDYKPELQGTTRGGIDMVALKDDTAYLLDNKALSRTGNVNSVSALITNFADNVKETLRSLQEMATETTRTAAERELIDRTIAALENGNYLRAVTNANVAKDDRILEGISERLERQGIEFIDVMRRKA